MYTNLDYLQTDQQLEVKLHSLEHTKLTATFSPFTIDIFNCLGQCPDTVSSCLDTVSPCLNTVSPSSERCHNLRNGKEASEDTEESPARCAGEGKQSKGNYPSSERGFMAYGSRPLEKMVIEPVIQPGNLVAIASWYGIRGIAQYDKDIDAFTIFNNKESVNDSTTKIEEELLREPHTNDRKIDDEQFNKKEVSISDSEERSNNRDTNDREINVDSAGEQFNKDEQFNREQISSSDPEKRSSNAFLLLEGPDSPVFQSLYMLRTPLPVSEHETLVFDCVHREGHCWMDVVHHS